MTGSGALVAKLGALTLAAALTAGAMLAVRQRRILAANSLIETHRRIVQHERSLRQIRADIGLMIAPSRVEQLAGALGPMRPAAPLPPGGAARPDRAVAQAPDGVNEPKAPVKGAPPARQRKSAPQGPLTLHPGDRSQPEGAPQ